MWSINFSRDKIKIKILHNFIRQTQELIKNFMKFRDIIRYIRKIIRNLQNNTAKFLRFLLYRADNNNLFFLASRAHRQTLIQHEPFFIHCYTGLCNHNRIVFKEMSSWTALLVHLGMKKTFQTKYKNSKHVRIFIIMIINFHNIIRKSILTLEQH